MPKNHHLFPFRQLILVMISMGGEVWQIVLVNDDDGCSAKSNLVWRPAISDAKNC
jgi:hypothetical protein